MQNTIQFNQQALTEYRDELISIGIYRYSLCVFNASLNNIFSLRENINLGIFTNLIKYFQITRLTAVLVLSRFGYVGRHNQTNENKRTALAKTRSSLEYKSAITNLNFPVSKNDRQIIHAGYLMLCNRNLRGLS